MEENLVHISEIGTVVEKTIKKNNKEYSFLVLLKEDEYCVIGSTIDKQIIVLKENNNILNKTILNLPILKQKDYNTSNIEKLTGYKMSETSEIMRLPSYYINTQFQTSKIKYYYISNMVPVFIKDNVDFLHKDEIEKILLLNQTSLTTAFGLLRIKDII